MVDIQSGYGKISVFEDFTSPENDETWVAGGFAVGNVSVTSVNEGTIEYTVDESGGILALTTDTADNDNVALYVTPMRPADGRMVLEVRVKTDAVTTTAIFAGFSETLAIDTPVMPAEYATATMTYNGTGGIVGAVWDPDATTNVWRSALGDGGAISGTSSTVGGVAATSLPVVVSAGVAVNNVWDVIRCEVGNDGSGLVSVNGVILEERAAVVTATDLLHPVVMFENRDGSANVVEIDYFAALGGRNWSNGA